jgi:hypothetical protein
LESGRQTNSNLSLILGVGKSLNCQLLQIMYEVMRDDDYVTETVVGSKCSIRVSLLVCSNKRPKGDLLLFAVWNSKAYSQQTL